MSFQVESIIIPLYLERSNFDDFYKHVESIFKNSSSFHSRIRDFRKFLNSRTPTTGADIGTIYRNKPSGILLRPFAAKRIAKEIQSIEIRAHRVSENIACITFQVRISEEYKYKPKEIYQSEIINVTTISKLGSVPYTSSISHSPIESARRALIKGLLDSIHESLLNSDIIKHSGLVAPSTVYLSKSRVEVYKIDNYSPEIFSDDRNFRRDNFLRTLAFSHTHYKYAQNLFFEFASLDNQSSSPHKILYYGQMPEEEMDIWNFLNAFMFIAVRQIYIESVGNKLFRTENSFSKLKNLTGSKRVI